MKKLLGLLAFLIIVPSVCQASVPVKSRMHKFEAAFLAAAMVPDDGDIDGSVYLQGGLNYGVWDPFAIGVSVGWWTTDFETSLGTNGNRLNAGEITAVPIFADFIFRSAERNRDFAYYGVIGLGGMIVSADGNGDLTPAGLMAEAGDGFAAKLGAGIDWFLDPNWVLNVEGGYIFTNANVKTLEISTGNEVDDRDLDHWYVGAGVKYLYP